MPFQGARDEGWPRWWRPYARRTERAEADARHRLEETALYRGAALARISGAVQRAGRTAEVHVARGGGASVATRSNTFIPTHIQPLRFQSTKNIFIKATCLLLELYQPTHDRHGASRGRERLARGALAQVGVLAAVAIALFFWLCRRFVPGNHWRVHQRGDRLTASSVQAPLRVEECPRRESPKAPSRGSSGLAKRPFLILCGDPGARV